MRTAGGTGSTAAGAAAGEALEAVAGAAGAAVGVVPDGAAPEVGRGGVEQPTKRPIAAKAAISRV